MFDSLKKVAGTFVSFDESKPNLTTRKAMDEAKAGETSKDAPILVPSVNLEKFQNYFSEFMAKLDLPGPDYFEFSVSDKDLAPDVPTREARFKVIFKSMKPSGLTKEILLSSGQKYLTEIDKDHESFVKGVSEKEAQEIASREKEIGALESENASIDQQIASLQRQKDNNEVSIGSLKLEIKSAKEKIQNNVTGYEIAYKATKESIASDLDLIQKIL